MRALNGAGVARRRAGRLRGRPGATSRRAWSWPASSARATGRSSREQQPRRRSRCLRGRLRGGDRALRGARRRSRAISATTRAAQPVRCRTSASRTRAPGSCEPARSPCSRRASRRHCGWPTSPWSPRSVRIARARCWSIPNAIRPRRSALMHEALEISRELRDGPVPDVECLGHGSPASRAGSGEARLRRRTAARRPPRPCGRRPVARSRRTSRPGSGPPRPHCARRSERRSSPRPCAKAVSCRSPKRSPAPCAMRAPPRPLDLPAELPALGRIELETVGGIELATHVNHSSVAFWLAGSSLRRSGFAAAKAR